MCPIKDLIIGIMFLEKNRSHSTCNFKNIIEYLRVVKHKKVDHHIKDLRADLVVTLMAKKNSQV